MEQVSHSPSKFFPSLLIDMLAVGEETGDMPGALAHITRRYDTELDRLGNMYHRVRTSFNCTRGVSRWRHCRLLASSVLTLTDSLRLTKGKR